MGCGASQATTSAAVSEPVNQPVKPNRPAPIRVEESPRSARDGPASSSAKLPSAILSGTHGPKTHGSQDTATPGDLKEVAFSEVAHLHKEFEDVSAPMATMTLPNLTKFQTRVLRKHGDKIMKRLSMGNPIHALKKGTGDKELRDQAKKTATLVFKRLGYWNEETKEPIPEKTVSFDEWLALVYKTKVNYEGDHSKAGAYTPSQERRNGSILKRDGKFSGGTSTLESPTRATPASGDGSTPHTAEDNKNGHGAGGIRYPDNPTEEELESEWQIFLENDIIKHKHHDHADEGSAFKAVKAASKETGETPSAGTHLHPEEEDEDTPAQERAGARLPQERAGARLGRLPPLGTAAPEPGFSAAAEDGGGQWGGGNLAAATRDVQVSGVRGNGGRGDGAGAEAAGGSCGGATAQIGSQPDGQNAGEEGGINSDQKAVMAGAGSAAVAKHSVREGGGRAVVTAANQGQIASDAPGSAAGDTEVPKGNESEGGGISGSATRKGLVSECVYYLTDEEVEYKVHAIQDIREQSHKHKLAVAMQSSEHRSSMSKSTAHAKRHSAHGAVSFEASMLEVVSKTTTAVTNTSASMDGWNTTISVSRAVAAFKKAGQGAHNSQVGPVAATLS